MWILVAEDDRRMAELLERGLGEEGHRVALAASGTEALEAARRGAFDAMILDIMLPGADGFEVVRRLRAERNPVPIIVVTARDALADVVRGLDLGADDYLTKPFAFAELLARLRTISRRAQAPASPLLTAGDLTLDPATWEVVRGGRRIELTPTEFRLLEFLLRRKGRVATRSAILDAVWGYGSDVESNTVDAFIRLLRAKIDSGEDVRLIRTIRGVGYSLRPDGEP
jgi:DNA-binding response OmpR family regulator